MHKQLFLYIVCSYFCSMEMISEARRKKINSKFRELIKACEAFASEEDYRNISKAYEIAFKAELEKYKKSGDLNIMHSLEFP